MLGPLKLSTKSLNLSSDIHIIWLWCMIWPPDPKIHRKSTYAALWGGGVKNLPNLPTHSGKKLPMVGVGVKNRKKCWRLKWMIPYLVRYHKALPSVFLRLTFSRWTILMEFIQNTPKFTKRWKSHISLFWSRYYWINLK